LAERIEKRRRKGGSDAAANHPAGERTRSHNGFAFFGFFCFFRLNCRCQDETPSRAAIISSAGVRRPGRSREAISHPFRPAIKPPQPWGVRTEGNEDNEAFVFFASFRVSIEGSAAGVRSTAGGVG